jgi:hypothetical protein
VYWVFCTLDIEGALLFEETIVSAEEEFLPGMYSTSGIASFFVLRFEIYHSCLPVLFYPDLFSNAVLQLHTKHNLLYKTIFVSGFN